MASKKEPTTDQTPQAGIDTSEWDKGYRGDVPDPTPNRNYAVDGVTADAPTPETTDTPANDTLLETSTPEKEAGE